MFILSFYIAHKRDAYYTMLIPFRNFKSKQMVQEIPIMQQCQAVTYKHRGEPGAGQSSVSEVEV